MLRIKLRALIERDPLWRNADYMRLFAGCTLTTLGSTISQMALPLTAIELLHASATQMGMLAAAELAPFALFALPAGVWVDRSRKKRLAAAFEFSGALALATIPIAYLLGVLSFALICCVGFIIGCGFAIGGTAMQVFVTQLVGKEHLMAANGRIQAASSIAGILGPALAALAVAGFGAPLAVAFDALGFCLSGLLLLSIKRDDPPSVSGTPQALWPEIKVGLDFVWHSPVLRALTIGAAVWLALFDGFRALYVLFASRELGFNPHSLATLNTCGAVGALIGAMLSPRLEKRFGARAMVITGYLLTGLGYAAYALAPAGSSLSLLAAGAAMLTIDIGATLYSVTYLSLRQQVTPDAMLGRVIATMRCASVAATPVGAALAGRSGDTLGLSPTLLLLGALGVLLALGACWRMPHLAQQPALKAATVRA